VSRLLFGAPGDWTSRHPRVMISAVIALVLMAEWLADVAAAVGVA